MTQGVENECTPCPNELHCRGPLPAHTVPQLNAACQHIGQNECKPSGTKQAALRHNIWESFAVETLDANATRSPSKLQRFGKGLLMRGWASLADKTLDEPPSPEVAYSSCCLLPKRNLALDA